ncbi:hypothetical protein ACWGOE_01730 [Leucobacter chromiiresistens]
MSRLTVSDVAEKHLTRWLEGLVSGEIPAGALPPSVVDFYYFGYFEGRESRQDEIEALRQNSQQGEIDRLNHLVDVYWAEAHLTKDERRESILQRLDAGLQAADADTWDRIEAELYEALADRQLNNSIGADIASAVAQRRPHDGSTQARGERAA